MLSPSATAKLLQIRLEIAAMLLQAKLLRFRVALKAGFDPNQPRVPAGRADGGRWTRDGGVVAEDATRVAQAERPAPRSTCSKRSGAAGTQSPRMSGELPNRCSPASEAERFGTLRHR
jgi:hypothetical protein